MPYVQLQDMRLGMDRSRVSRVASELGSAWTIKNAHITRGGDIERQKSFVKIGNDFPATTKGLFAVNETLYTVGYDASEAGNVPSGVTHILTQHPTPATPMTAVLDAEAFNGELYSISQFSDGNVYHFYDTDRVTDWDTLSASIGSNNAIAAALEAAIDNSAYVNASVSTNVVTVTSAVAGTPFTISGSTVNNGSVNDQSLTVAQTQPNVAAVTEVLATATVTVTGGTANSGTNNMVSITVDGVNILGGNSETLATGGFTVTGGTSNPGTNTIDEVLVNSVDVLGAAVDHTGDNTTTAAAIAAQITSNTSSPNYTATNSGAVVTISAVAGSGSSPNTFTVAVNVSGDPTVGSLTAFSGGAYAGVPWVTSNSATAEDIADAITANTSSPNYNATSDGAVVTISAVAGSGAGPNGFVIVTNEAGDVTSTHDAAMAGGVTAVTAVAQINTVTVGGTFEEADQFTVTINGTEDYVVTGAGSGTGTTVQTFKKKVYTVAASNLYFSALNAPTQWISGTDYGFINMGSESVGQETLTATAEYQGLMAIFSENNIRVWSISEDSSLNSYLQTIQNTGTVAPNSVVAYGNNDVFYLAQNGVRSIKARDSSNAAYVSDVGTAIDTHIRAYLDTLTEAQVAAATAIIEPVDGRYWLAVGTRVYVFSFFPSKKISGWSYYDLDITITHFAKVGDRIYARATDSGGDDGLYLYGGANNDTYPGDDEGVVEIELPYITANNPAAFKDLIGFDLIATNEWKVEILPDPAREDVKKNQGIAVGTTYGKQRFGATGVSSMFGVNLTCRKSGAATLSALALHYNDKFEDG